MTFYGTSWVGQSHGHSDDEVPTKQTRREGLAELRGLGFKREEFRDGVFYSQTFFGGDQ